MVENAMRRYIQKSSGRKFINASGEFCAFYCSDFGINVRFVSLQRESVYASLVRDKSGNYSIGLSMNTVFQRRGYAIILFVISCEMRYKGFLHEYIRNCKVIDTPKIRGSITYLEQMLKDMEEYMESGEDCNFSN